MNRFILSLCLLLSASTIYAEGYQVNTLSAKQLGMGHVGAGMKLGAQSLLFNPAGLGFMEETIDLSVGFTATSPSASAVVNGQKYKTDNDISTPLHLYAGFKVYDNLNVGISLTTPYGNGINWGQNWPGAVLNQKVSLMTFSVQPTVAWRITPKLSVGAGLMIAWGNVDMDKGLVNPESVDLLLESMGSPARFGAITPASVNLKGDANVRVGFNVGAMFDATDKLTIGASFRSKIQMKVEAGEATVSYANQLAETLLEGSMGLINHANFSAEMPMPYILTLGTSYKVNPKLILAFDAQLTGWKAYKSLDVEFAPEALSGFNQYLPKNYHNAWAFRFGAQYALTNRFDIRAGRIYDNTPVDDNYYNPETPGMDKLTPSIGASFRPTSRFSIDVSLAYVAGLGADNKSYTYDDLLLKSLNNPAIPYVKTFTANYDSHAICASIGVGYKF